MIGVLLPLQQFDCILGKKATAVRRQVTTLRVIERRQHC